MPGSFKKEDLRIQKTNIALSAAISNLLERQNFNQITVNDICEEALISRSTFYFHFKDKYDLLEFWLKDIKNRIEKERCGYDDAEKYVNDIINANKNKVKNLIENCNSETSDLLCDFLLSLLNINADDADKPQTDPDSIVLSSVCCGGVLNYLLWQVTNKFPTELPVMNPYIYDILFHFKKLGGGRKYSADDQLAQKINQLKTLQSGRGIQYLLNEAYRIFGNPISMHDMDDKTIAYTENVITDDPFWNECVANGAVSDQTLELFRSEYFIYDIANAKAVSLLKSEKFKYERIFGKIYAEESYRVANMCMIACNKPFDQDDPEIFEEFCQILSNEIKNCEFYLNYGRTYQKFLISQLINGSMIDKLYYSARIEDIYKGLKPYLRLAVMDITQCESENRNPEHYRNLFMRTKPEYKYYVYADYVVAIISSDNAALSVGEDLEQLGNLFRQSKISVGISNHFENLFELCKHYNEASDALKYGIDHNQRISLYGGSK